MPMQFPGVDSSVNNTNTFSPVTKWGTSVPKVLRVMSINWTRTIFYTSNQLEAFTDDSYVIGRETLAVKELFIEMKEDEGKVGLVIY